MRIALPILALSLVAAAHAQQYKSVRDWVGACDNQRHCSALGMAAEDAEQYAVLQLERGPLGSDDVSRILIRAYADLASGQVLALHADDGELLAIEDRHLIRDPDLDAVDIVIDEPAELKQLMGAFRRASSLSLTRDQQAIATISLSGASAIMLWIDEVQDRLDTRTALVRIGNRSPQEVAAAPQLPVAPRAAGGATDLPSEKLTVVSQRLRGGLEGDVCEDLDPETGLGDSGWSLADGRLIVQLSCSRGAYNFSSRWFLLEADGSNSGELSFPVPSDDGSGRISDQLELVNAGFDPATGQLSSFNKGRGLGDCGFSGDWQWTGQRFELVAYSQMGECRGVGPDLWPVIWRTQRGPG